MPTSAKSLLGIIITACMFLAGYAAGRTDKPEKAKDLVCGMEVDQSTAYKSQFKGKTYYFCAETCKKSFDANPEKYIQKEEDRKSGTVKDLVCGMDVDPRSPRTFKTEYKGRTYFFCAETCKKSFEADPPKYIAKTAAAKGQVSGHSH